MKNKKILIVVSLLILASCLSVFLFIGNRNPEDLVIYSDEPQQKELTEEEKIDLKIEAQLQEMTLREKIGQMIIIAYEGNDMDELNAILTEVKPSGFILFPNNISNYDDTVTFISNIKSTAKVPMIISIDQEGGRVQRIKNIEDVNVQTIPAMLELGKTNNPELSYKVGSIVAKELSAFGINTDFAPVIDIFSNPNNTVIGDRAFGSDAQTVINMAIPFANGMKSENVIPVYKHFPGHGDTDADSHIELPVITKTKEELYINELLPFKEAIKNNAQMIMVAHIALPNVTGDYTPASISKVMIQDILRDELKFNGVVITDAINMKALYNNCTLEEICKYSINAGVDIILMPPDPVTTLATIEELVSNGNISMDKIDSAVKRVLKLKYTNKLDETVKLNKENIGTQENIDIINSI